jgi:isoquinoline 1-oxidoreductase alpha subunit
MPTYNLSINGKTYTVEAEANTPLMWVLRDNLQLTGTKYGCGIAQCGACTVHFNGSPVRSCTKANPNPTDDDIASALQGNICRCGTYIRIQKAVKKAAANMR